MVELRDAFRRPPAPRALRGLHSVSQPRRQPVRERHAEVRAGALGVVAATPRAFDAERRRPSRTSTSLDAGRTTISGSNAGGGRFEKRAARCFPPTPWGAMGAKVLDWNGDGRLDLFVTDMHTDMSSPTSSPKRRSASTIRRRSFRRDSSRPTETTSSATRCSPTGAAGVNEESDTAGVETGWPWGPSAGDLNADGWPDLFVAAGMNYPFRYRGNDVLLNDGGKRFVPMPNTSWASSRGTGWCALVGTGLRRRDVKQDICQGEAEPLLAEDRRAARATRQGARSPRPRHGVGGARQPLAPRLLDLDDDGDLDIVTNNYGDVPQVLMSDLASAARCAS